MKNENILADIKSKSLKEARAEIDAILGKLESQETDLNESINDYQRLIELNKHIEDIFKKKFKEFQNKNCLLYTSPSPRDISGSRMPSSA